jgi:hypothetical protein
VFGGAIFRVRPPYRLTSRSIFLGRLGMRIGNQIVQQFIIAVE